MNTQPAKCDTCQRRPDDRWGCSHISCPTRKPVTAQPSDRAPPPPEDDEE